MQEYFSRDVDSKNKKDYGGISKMFGAQGTETIYAEKGIGLKTGNDNNVFVRTCEDSTISNLNLKGSKILPAEVEIIDLASFEKQAGQDEEGDRSTQVEHEVTENEDSSEISIGKNDNAIEICSLQDDSVPSIQKSPSDQTKIDEASSVDVLDNNEDNQGNLYEKKEETNVNSNEQNLMRENHQIKKKFIIKAKVYFMQQ